MECVAAFAWNHWPDVVEYISKRVPLPSGFVTVAILGVNPGAILGAIFCKTRLVLASLWQARLKINEKEKAKSSVFLSFWPLFGGAPGRIRTCGTRIRNPVLYPAELREHKRAI